MNRVAQNISSLFLSRAFSIVCSVGLAIVIARFLGPESYGQFALLFVLIGYFTLVVDFGMSDTCVRMISASQETPEEMFLPTLLPRIATYSISALLFMAIIFGFKKEMIGPSMVGVLILLPEAIYLVYDATFRGVQKMRPLAVSEIVFSLFRTVLAGAVVFLGGDLTQALSAILLAEMIRLFVVVWYSKRVYGRIVFSNWWVKGKSLMKDSFFIFAWRAIGVLYYSMTLPIISILFGDTTAGNFRVSMNFIDLPIGFANILFGALFPTLSALHTTSLERYHDTVKEVLAVCVGIFPALYLLVLGWGSPLIGLVFGSKYTTEATSFLPVLFIQFLTTIVLINMGTVFLVQRWQRAAFMISLSMVIMRGLLLLLIGARSPMLSMWIIIGTDFCTMLAYCSWAIYKGRWAISFYSKPLFGLLVGVVLIMLFLIVRSWSLLPLIASVPLLIVIDIVLLHKLRIVNLLQFKTLS